MVVTERGGFTCCSFRCVLISAAFSRGIQSSRRRVPLVKLMTIGMVYRNHESNASKEKAMIFDRNHLEMIRFR